jgi:sec-independent protein translocase protein TatB
VRPVCRGTIKVSGLKKMYLAIFEFLGTSELLVILVVALIIFGPRKLPQLSRQLGKSLGEFKRASEDFKRTWEREVEMEKFEEEGRMARAMLQDEATISDANDRRSALDAALPEEEPRVNETLQPIVARSSSVAEGDEPQPVLAADTSPAPDTSGKRDWL